MTITVKTWADVLALTPTVGTTVIVTEDGGGFTWAKFYNPVAHEWQFCRI